MEIIGRNPTPDKYTIENVRLNAERTQTLDPQTGKAIGPTAILSLYVSLKPELYVRQRFESGISVEAKQNACDLKIEFAELGKMVESLSDELRICYRFLAQKGLLDDIAKSKKESARG